MPRSLLCVGCWLLALPAVCWWDFLLWLARAMQGLCGEGDRVEKYHGNNVLLWVPFLVCVPPMSIHQASISISHPFHTPRTGLLLTDRGRSQSSTGVGTMRVLGSVLALAGGLSACQTVSAFVAPAASIRQDATGNENNPITSKSDLDIPINQYNKISTPRVTGLYSR